MVRAPRPSNRSFDITTPAWRALRIAVTPTPCSAASCDSGASVARPTPRPSTTMFFQDGCELEAGAERTGDVELVARLQRRHAARAAAFALVEKFDLARRLVDPVDAHRPAHPHLGAVRRRAQQVKHLAGIGLQRVLMHLEDDVLVFVVDPVVGDDVADELAHEPLRIGVDVADPQGGIGVVVVRSAAWPGSLISRQSCTCIGMTGPCVNFGTVRNRPDFSGWPAPSSSRTASVRFIL